MCEHSLIYSRGSMGFTELTEDEKAMMKPVRQRLVRTHPVTGRKSLYLSSHAGTIIGWPVPEARDFLRDLNEHATQRELVYIHRWRLHDLVMWDNRQTMHRVRRFDESQPRDMRRTTVAGEAMTASRPRQRGGAGVTLSLRRSAAAADCASCRRRISRPASAARRCSSRAGRSRISSSTGPSPVRA